MESTLTVRINKRTHKALRDLSQATGQPMTDLLDEAVQLVVRKRFQDAFNAAYAALKSDPGAWSDAMEEDRAWESTLGDGLEEPGR